MAQPAALEPLPYHREVLAYLRSEEPRLWDWFSSHRIQQEHADAVRLELLKTTYRVEPGTAPRLHEIANRVSARLQLNVPITFYHSQRSSGLNASLAFLPQEAHVVLHGPITDVLSDEEIEALLGHELSHLLLWTNWDGEYLIADQILAAMAGDTSAEPAQAETARLFRLYTEIFCDRGSLAACGALSAAVSSLVKTETGLRDISAESYLRQSEEIFSRGDAKTEGLTHPECFIRARALRLWQEDGADAEAEIRRMIEGPPSLVGLDLLGQVRIARLTRRLIDQLLTPAWMQTEVTLGHARLFFDDYVPPDASPADDSLADDLSTPDSQLQDYYCYVLLDFVTTDRELDEGPLAAAYLLVERLGLADRFHAVVLKELGIAKKQLEKIRRDAERIIAQSAEAAEVS